LALELHIEHKDEVRSPIVALDNPLKETLPLVF
jgi:hypothetical protein